MENSVAKPERIEGFKALAEAVGWNESTLRKRTKDWLVPAETKVEAGHVVCIYTQQQVDDLKARCALMPKRKQGRKKGSKNKLQP